MTDYTLLIAPSITNRHARAFLHEQDRNVIYRTLENSRVPKTRQNARVIHYDLRPLYLGLS